jgi:hypothetical protein
MPVDRQLHLCSHMRLAPKRDEHHMPAAAVCDARLYIPLFTPTVPDLDNHTPPVQHHRNPCITPPAVFRATTTYISPRFQHHQEPPTTRLATAYKQKVTSTRAIHPREHGSGSGSGRQHHIAQHTHFRSPNPSLQQCIRRLPTTWARNQSRTTGPWRTPGLS